jgi:propanediol dehydratase small subunit
MTRAYSGRDAAEVTLDDVRSGRVSVDDIRIHPDTLERQAQVAEANGNPQLAANLRRAAELTAMSDAEVMALYDALRPGRSTAAQLQAHAEQLAARGADRNAALFHQAAATYARRGLTAAEPRD